MRKFIAVASLLGLMSHCGTAPAFADKAHSSYNKRAGYNHTRQYHNNHRGNKRMTVINKSGQRLTIIFIKPKAKIIRVRKRK